MLMASLAMGTAMEIVREIAIANKRAKPADAKMAIHAFCPMEKNAKADAKDHAREIADQTAK